MIAHISVPARNPQDTSLFLAALIGGTAFEFPVVPDAWIAVANDGSGTAIEVYPASMAHHPGRGDVDPRRAADGPETMPWEDQIFSDGEQVRPSAFHVALTTHLEAGEVLRLAETRKWRALACERAGVFGVIEVWIDDTVLVEVLTGAEAMRYRQFMTPAGCAPMFGAGRRP